MYYVLYGLRVLGIFPNEVDAKNYMYDIECYDDRYMKTKAFSVEYYNTPKIETIMDLLENA